MPFDPPTAANDYQAPPAPNRFVVDRSVWNGVFGSIGGRLQALEDVSSGIEQIKLELQNFGIQRLDEAINPLIVQTQMSLAILQAEVGDAQDELDATISDAQAAFATALATANASLAAVQHQLDLMLDGGVPAVNVAVSAIDTLAATTVQGALAEIVAEFNTAMTAMNNAVGSKAVKLAWSAKSASFAAVAGNAYLITNALTATLPAEPAEEDTIGFLGEAAETTPYTLNLNGKTFEGVTTNVTIGKPFLVLFTYRLGAWRLI